MRAAAVMGPGAPGAFPAGRWTPGAREGGRPRGWGGAVRPLQSRRGDAPRRILVRWQGRGSHRPSRPWGDRRRLGGRRGGRGISEVGAVGGGVAALMMAETGTGRSCAIVSTTSRKATITAAMVRQKKRRRLMRATSAAWARAAITSSPAARARTRSAASPSGGRTTSAGITGGRASRSHFYICGTGVGSSFSIGSAGVDGGFFVSGRRRQGPG